MLAPFAAVETPRVRPLAFLKAMVCALTELPLSPVTLTGLGAAVTLAEAMTNPPALVLKETLTAGSLLKAPMMSVPERFSEIACALFQWLGRIS